jgi:hypothetical protein
MHPGVLIASALAGIFGVAVVALIVSNKASTKDVLTSGGGALAAVINAAVSPVTGGNGTGALTSNPGSGAQVTNPTASPV